MPKPDSLSVQPIIGSIEGCISAMPTDITAKSVKMEQDVLQRARDVLRIEAKGLLDLADKLDNRFTTMVQMITECPGRLIVSGIGKSGIIGRKIVATLNSTGSNALFLHPVEAMHGDLGVVKPGDIFMALSAGGETDELNHLLPSIRTRGCQIIALCGNPHSHLARQSDLLVDVGVDAEACPLGLVPTTSTTAMLAIGDALAVVLSEKLKFKSDDFRRIHPGGLLGKRLSSRVSDLMASGKRIPKVRSGSSMQDAVTALDRGGLGAVLVLNDRQELSGIITDGDIRRMVVSQKSIENLRVEQVMTPQPQTVTPEVPSYDALNLMERRQITVLPVTDQTGLVKGILHLHEILGKGAFKFSGSTE